MVDDGSKYHDMPKGYLLDATIVGPGWIAIYSGKKTIRFPTRATRENARRDAWDHAGPDAEPWALSESAVAEIKSEERE